LGGVRLGRVPGIRSDRQRRATKEVATSAVAPTHTHSHQNHPSSEALEVLSSASVNWVATPYHYP